MNLDRMRAKQREIQGDLPQPAQQATVTVPVRQGHVRPEPPAKPKPPICGHEDVTAKCGHAVQVPVYELAKDKFRAQRIDKEAKRDCPECRQKAQEAVQKAAGEARKAKGSPKHYHDSQGESGRLPNGSRFDVLYDGLSKHWSGWLYIPIADGRKEFCGRASGVFSLLRKLDQQYRQWVAESEGKP